MNLVNVQERARKHPTFQIPSDEEIKSLKAGDYVKVIIGGERVWVKISLIDGENYGGVLDNNCVIEPHKRGDTVKFKVENIAGIFDKRVSQK